MSYIKRVYVDNIVDLYLNGKTPEEIASMMSLTVEDVKLITGNLEIEELD